MSKRINMRRDGAEMGGPSRSLISLLREESESWFFRLFCLHIYNKGMRRATYLRPTAVSTGDRENPQPWRLWRSCGGYCGKVPRVAQYSLYCFRCYHFAFLSFESRKFSELPVGPFCNRLNFFFLFQLNYKTNRIRCEKNINNSSRKWPLNYI